MVAGIKGRVAGGGLDPSWSSRWSPAINGLVVLLENIPTCPLTRCAAGWPSSPTRIQCLTLSPALHGKRERGGERKASQKLRKAGLLFRHYGYGSVLAT